MPIEMPSISTADESSTRSTHYSISDLNFVPSRSGNQSLRFQHKDGKYFIVLLPSFSSSYAEVVTTSSSFPDRASPLESRTEDQLRRTMERLRFRWVDELSAGTFVSSSLVRGFRPVIDLSEEHSFSDDFDYHPENIASVSEALDRKLTHVQPIEPGISLDEEYNDDY